MNEQFLVSGGSVPGREHARLHRNNQDGLALRVTAERVVAVVTDGCSSGRFSEVGARLGAFQLAELALSIPMGDPQDFADALQAGLVDWLGGLAGGLSGASSLAQRVADFGLFTWLAAVVTADQAVVIGLGDGAFAHDGRLVCLDPGPDNAPAYAGYALVDAADLTAEIGVRPAVHLVAPTAEVDALLVATDGLTDAPELAAELCADPRYAKNPFCLHRRLVVLGPNARRLPDDTTVALLRRRDGAR
ncbi:MAG: protein phosphatase 2C domain-containing protein [Alphaproteobacteria bacterium]|nr:protein phosphatase 2C domain-containing protein [Alphaproteobacteria bacterium]